MQKIESVHQIESRFSDLVELDLENWLYKRHSRTRAEQIYHSIKDRWSTTNWPQAFLNYFDAIERSYSSFQILGMANPTAIEDIFTDVDVLKQPTAHRIFQRDQLQFLSRMYLEHRHLGEQNEIERYSGLELVQNPDFKHLFILGKPGSGKTTFLKYIALQALHGRLEKLPIFIPLKAFADSGLDLPSYLEKKFAVCRFPDAGVVIDYLLSSGQAIVLLDGLDEVNKEEGHRERVLDMLNDLSTQYRASQMLITCRIAANEYQFENFKYVEMADFSDWQIQQFVTKWFTEKDDCQPFLEELQNDKRLKELGQSPLLLTLLCLVFEANREIPKARSDLYYEAIDALLRKWDAGRKIKRDEIYRGLSIGRKRNLFARLAAEAFNQGQFLIPQATVEARITQFLQALPPQHEPADIDSEHVLKAIEAQHGILVERANRIYSFSHLSFQEYFTARYLVEGQGRLEGLFAHITDKKWHEVFLLTVEMTDDADTFLGNFLHSIQQFLSGQPQVFRVFQDNAAPTPTHQSPLEKVMAYQKLIQHSKDSVVNQLYYLMELFFNCLSRAFISRSRKKYLEDLVSLLEDSPLPETVELPMPELSPPSRLSKLTLIKGVSPNLKHDPMAKALPFTIKQFQIEHFQCIQHAGIVDVPVDSPWIFLIGDNGDGKTSVLQSLAIGLHGDLDADPLFDSKDCRIALELQKKEAPQLVEFHWDEDHWAREEHAPSNRSLDPESWVVGYGPSRLEIQGELSADQERAETSPVYSLLRQRGNLRNLEHWMKDQTLEANEAAPIRGQKIRERLQNIQNVMQRLMPNVEGIKQQGSRFLYLEKGHWVPSHHLSAGHKSLLAMIGDLCIRLFEQQTDVLAPTDLQGIVLIDEIETHLHPRWQKNMPRLLSDVFPGLQFIASTHSALVFLGAPSGSVFLKVTRDFQQGTHIEPIDIDVSQLLPNAILTSPLFDLESLTHPVLEDFSQLQTADDYREALQRMKLKHQLEAPEESP